MNFKGGRQRSIGDTQVIRQIEQALRMPGNASLISSGPSPVANLFSAVSKSARREPMDAEGRLTPWLHHSVGFSCGPVSLPAPNRIHLTSLGRTRPMKTPRDLTTTLWNPPFQACALALPMRRGMTL